MKNITSQKTVSPLPSSVLLMLFHADDVTPDSKKWVDRASRIAVGVSARRMKRGGVS